MLPLTFIRRKLIYLAEEGELLLIHEAYHRHIFHFVKKQATQHRELATK